MQHAPADCHIFISVPASEKSARDHGPKPPNTAPTPNRETRIVLNIDTIHKMQPRYFPGYGHLWSHSAAKLKARVQTCFGGPMEKVSSSNPSRRKLGKLRAWLSGVALSLAVALGGAAPDMAQAAQPAPTVTVPSPFIVLDDYGGSVRDRYIAIRALAKSGRAVEIRGRVCFSSCTMLLGLKGTCVRPETRFGFHGPSRSGKPLPPSQFDLASRIIASGYPPALRSWYMDTARYRLVGLHLRTGAELIALGLVNRCDDAAQATYRSADRKPA